MAVGLILEFEGVTDQEYYAVNDELGIDMGTGWGDWPEGLLTHSAGLNEYGHLVVLEVWDTPEHQVRFMEERLGEALARGGITGPPSSVTWIELVSHHPVVVAPAKRAVKKAPAKRAVKKAPAKKAPAKKAPAKKAPAKKATARRA
jgi:hypothetical protein